jgi:hypothetical protein
MVRSPTYIVADRDHVICIHYARTLIKNLIKNLPIGLSFTRHTRKNQPRGLDFARSGEVYYGSQHVGEFCGRTNQLGSDSLGLLGQKVVGLEM